MRKKLAQSILLAIALLLVGVVLYSGKHNFRSISEAGLFDLFYLSLLVVAGNLLAAEQFYGVYKAAGIKMSRRTNFSIFTVGAFGNLLPGQVGTFGRLELFRRRFDLSLARHTGLLFFLFLISSVCGLAVSVIILGAQIIFNGLETGVPLLFIVGLSLACLLTLLQATRRSSRVLQRWPKLLNGQAAFRGLLSQQLLILRLLLTEIGIILCLTTRFHILLEVFGSSVPLAFLIATSSLARAATSLAPTPGALGIRELVVGLGLSSGGGALTVSVLTGGLDRAIHFAFLILCAGMVAAAQIAQRLSRREKARH